MSKDKKKLVYELHKITTDLKTISIGIAEFFAYKNGIDAVKSKSLKKLFINNNFTSKVLQVLDRYYETICFDDIIFLYENIVDLSNKKQNGVVYTPENIRNYIVKHTLHKTNHYKVLDPSCGCGAFLFSSAIYLHSEIGLNYKKIFNDCLYGIDIDNISILKTKLLLSLLATSDGDYSDYDFNLYCFNSLDKRKLTKSIKDLRINVVIGNPPYVRYRNLSDENKKYYFDWTCGKAGNVDLYMLFFELGIFVLNGQGYLGFITPNSYIQAINARFLRNYILDNYSKVKIVDFRDMQLFNSVTSYTCITIIDCNSKDRNIYYSRCNNLMNISKLNFTEYSILEFEKDKPWRLCCKEDDDLIYKLENSGKNLSNWKIRNGLATLANDIYFFNEIDESGDYYVRAFNGKKYKIEKKICINIVKPNVIKNEKELAKKIERAIFPYVLKEDKYCIIDERKLKSKYPHTYKFLLDCKDILNKRDKGKNNYAAWYAYGRTQGMNNTGYKLLIPYIAGKPTAVLCKDKSMLFYCGYALISDDVNELTFLKIFLESDAFWYYLCKTSKPYSKGFMAFAKNYIVKFSIPSLTEKEKNKIINTKSNSVRNRLVWKSYGIESNLLEKA